MRTRVRWTLTTESGDVVPYALVRVYNADGRSVYLGPIYRDVSTDHLYPNPFNAAPVRLEFFLDQQVRIRLGFRTAPDAREVLSPVLDVLANADEVAYSIDALTIPTSEQQLVLRARTSTEVYWYRPGIGDHNHAGLGADSTELGPLSFGFSQISSYEGATILGGHDEHIDPDDVLSYTWGTLAAQYPTWGDLNGLPWSTFDQTAQSLLATPSGFVDTTAVGRSSVAAGAGATALGMDSRADEFDEQSGSVAAGHQATATGGSIVIGHQSATVAPTAVVLGSGATAARGGVALGNHSCVGAGGISLGCRTNADTAAFSASVVLGSNALTPHRDAPCVVLGVGLEGEERPSADDIEGTALLVQAFLSVLAPGDLQVHGDIAFGGATNKIGFFGHAATVTAFIGNDEVASGIEALDSLIYALRDLGLIRSRKDVLARYGPETLQQTHQEGDQIREWPDANHLLERRLVTALNTEPTYTGDEASFDAAQVPWEFALIANPLPPTKHVVVVARHHGIAPRAFEGLTGVYRERFRDRLVGDAVQPFSRSSDRWSTIGLSAFTIDGQPGGAQSTPDTRQHVYRATHREEWVNESIVLGAAGGDYSTGWWGAISEAATLDASWREKDIVSYTTGLTFLHNARNAADWVTNAALSFLRTQQGDSVSLAIQLGRDYPSSTEKRPVYGNVSGYQGISVKNVPLVRVGNAVVAMTYGYTGALSGYWSYLSNPQNYWVEVYSFSGDFTGTWTPSALVGRFALNASGTWSTGQQRMPRGNKRWRLVLRSNLSAVAIDEWLPGIYYDTAIKIYTVVGGTRTLESTVPLQGDGSWVGATSHPGRVVAELCRRSTGAVFATTDRHLPFDIVARPADADYGVVVTRSSIRTAALAVLAYAAAGQKYWSHAGDILRALTALQQPDGSLYAAYDATATPPAPYGATVATHDLAWVGLAALVLGRACGDSTRFQPLIAGIAAYLEGQQDPEGGSILDVPGGDYSTSTNALCWLFFRDLGEDSGVSLDRDIARDIEKALDNNHWVPELQRFTKSLGTTNRDTGADIWGGLYQLATGQRGRAKQSLRSLAYAKMIGITITDSYYGGATGLAGYLPTNTAGPHVLDQELTWGALLFKGRYGEPLGDDLSAMRRWLAVTPATVGSQFLSFSGSTGGLIARPKTTVAAMAFLVAQRTRLFWQLPVARPRVVAAQLTVTKLGPKGYQFTYEWAPEDEREPVFFETVAERSFDNGMTWVSMPSRSRSGQISEVRRTSDSIWPWLYGASWIEPGPLTNNIVTRVRVRMRANWFGAWGSTEGRYPDGRILPTPVVIGTPPRVFPT